MDTQEYDPVGAGLDAGIYPTGITVTDEEPAALNLKRADFHRAPSVSHPPVSSD